MYSFIRLILLASFLYFSVQAQADDPWLHLGKGKESMMPKLKNAVSLISRQPECIKVTEGSWGNVGNDIILPIKSGFTFRVTCEVSDLLGQSHDNFWIAPDKKNRDSIYRQSKGKFLSDSNTKGIETALPKQKKTLPNEMVVEKVEGNCSTALQKNLQKFLIVSGYKCSEISFCGALSSQNIRVTCNNNQFAYRIRDKGVGYYIEFD